MAQVYVIGRITADLELKTSEKNNSYVRFDIAENIGSRQNLHTQYFQICAWGEDANRLMKARAKKGSLIWVTGSLELETYPEATWEWREEFPERIVAKGGTGRIKLFGVEGFNFADVTFDQNAGIDCALVNVVPMAQLGTAETPVTKTEEAAAEPVAAPKQQNPVDPQVWYEVQGRKVLEALITDLHSRGYSSLTIRENGDIAIKQADSEKVKTAFESVPEKMYWTKLCKVFEREGMAANITDGGILLTW